jgi:stress-induced morphogen
LKVNSKYQNVDQVNQKRFFYKILDDEMTNKMPLDIIKKTKEEFNERLKNL